MSNFVVSARKYRPILFDSVVGQSHVTNTLKNAIKNDHLAHAFLFCGPRGVGKTTCARLLAKILNCENPTSDTEPCDVCPSCQSFNKNTSLNIHELDAASNNSVEHIRSLIEQVRFAPQSGRYKIYIIDEVHMLSQAAFNAFLKTLEEPPSYAIFILATTEKHKIIPTILSRCQIFDFKRIQVLDMVKHLQKICANEEIAAEEEALNIIAQKADGALRDALSIFDRVVSFSGQDIRYTDVVENLNILDYDYYFKIVETFLSENLSELLLLYDQILSKGFDGDIFITGLAEHLRNLLVAQNPKTIQLLEVSGSIKERYMEQAQRAKPSLILSTLSLANDCDVHYKLARNKRLHVEMTLIKMAYIQQALRLQQMPKVVHSTEKKTSENPINSDLAQNIVQDQAAKYESPSIPQKVEEKVEIQPKEKTIAEETKTIKKQEPTVSPKLELSATKEETSVPKTRKKLSKLRKGKSVLESLEEDIKTEQESTQEAALDWTLENLQELWKEYTSKIDSPSTKAIMNNCVLSITENQLSITVPSNRAKDIILRDGDLKSLIKITFQKRELDFDIQVKAEDVANKVPVKKRPVTDKEKYRHLLQINPLLKDFQKNFELFPNKK